MDNTSIEKILIIMPEYTMGGAETQLRHIIRHMENIGFNCDVLILHQMKRDRDLLLENDKKKYNIVSFKELNLLNVDENDIYISVLEYLVEDERYKNYYALMIFHEWLLPIVPFAEKAGIVCIYSERVDGSAISINDTYRNAVKECSILLCNSKWVKRRLDKKLNVSFRYIANGKEKIKGFDNDDNRRRKIHNILVPARLISNKNHIIVLKMLKDHPEIDVTVVFAGAVHDTGYASFLKKTAEQDDLFGRVVFAGMIDDMREAYRKADLIILPSLTEGTPNVVLEAFAYRRPVIVSDIQPERDVVLDPKLRFEPTDAEALYECLKYIDQMEDDAFYEMLDVHENFVKSEYSLEKMTSEFEKVFFEAKKTSEERERSGMEIPDSRIKNTDSGMLSKFKLFYNVLCRWVSLLQDKKKIEDYFHDHKYKRVSIYGYKELGELLHQALDDSDIEVSNIIDRNADMVRSRISVISPEEIFDGMSDVIVVTAISYFDDIKKELGPYSDIPVISLEEVIYGM